MCRLGGQKQSSVLHAYRRIHAHLSKCTVNFFCSHIAFDRIKHSRKVSQCGSVIALFKSIGGDARKGPILQITKIIIVVGLGVEILLHASFVLHHGVKHARQHPAVKMYFIVSLPGLDFAIFGLH